MAPIGSDSENEEEVGHVERHGDDVDPAIALTEREGEGSDYDEEEEEEDDDDDEVPEPKGTMSAQLGGSKPLAPSVALAAPKSYKPTKPSTKKQSKLPMKPMNNMHSRSINKPISKPTAVASTGSEAEDDEGEEHMTFTIAQRQPPNFTAYDAAADAESVRKRQTETTSAVGGAFVEPYIDPKLADENLIFKVPRVNKYVVGPASKRVHQKSNEPFKIDHTNFVHAKNPRAKLPNWIERLIDSDGSKVLATVCIVAIPWKGDTEDDISVIGCVKVDLCKDDTINDKQYDDFARKMPPTETAGIYMQLDERQMKRLYDITDSGLPTKYHPSNQNVHYRVVHKVEDYTGANCGWTLYVAPPKQRASSNGSRKAAADKAEGGGAMKKQKVTLQTTLTGAQPPPSETSASTTLAVVSEQHLQRASPENHTPNDAEDYSDGSAPPPPPQQQQQPSILMTAQAAAAMHGVVTVPQFSAKLPLVNWADNGGGTLTANLPNTYTYLLHPGPNGTLLIANLAPTH